MSNNRYIDLKSASSKWLFAVVLLLSFFSFSGFIAATQITLVKPQTTLIVRSDAGLSKSITLTRALVKTPVTEKQVLVFIDLYTRQTNVRLAVISNFCAQPKTALFYRVKAAPQNTSDEPAILLG